MKRPFSLLKGIRSGVLALLSMSATDASACTLIWDEAAAMRMSDAVVWGTYLPRAAEGAGDIKVDRRLKGPKAARLAVTWDTKWVDEGANCPVWQPDLDFPRGRFFLSSNGDGTFSVSAQIPRMKANN